MEEPHRVEAMQWQFQPVGLGAAASASRCAAKLGDGSEPGEVCSRRLGGGLGQAGGRSERGLLRYQRRWPPGRPFA